MLPLRPSRSPSRARSVEPSTQHHMDVSDCVDLENLTEESFVANLLSRFKRDQIYTYIDNVLLSVNPYKPLAQYTVQVIDGYKGRASVSGSPELPPHVYAVADNAWQSLKDLHTDQVIIITGESGSGKTEAFKLILQYITSAAGRSRDLETVRHHILLCNPVLEAFGNARTIHNENASRFGKYVELEFDYKGEPVGGYIHHYLLEKSRLTVQNRGERNFHIFHQLLAGADVHLLKLLKLQRNTENYHYLRSGPSNASSCHHHGDKEEFINTKKALESVGFSSEDVTNIFRLVAAVLKLGNLVFTPVNNIDGTEGCGISNEYELEDVAVLLSTQVEELRSALLYRTWTVGGSGPSMPVESSLQANCFSRDSTLPRRESAASRAFNHHPSIGSASQQSSHQLPGILSNSASMMGRDMYPLVDGCVGSEVGSSFQVSLNSRTFPDNSNEVLVADLSASEATATRDALCKAIYSRLFTWIVNSINERIKVKQPGKRRVLGLLDIYGFETLPSGNGFDQLIINYCNEKLHQCVAQLILKEEQEEYVHEGLEWTPVPVPDHHSVCDLIEKNPLGLLSILDDECQRPSHTTGDIIFLQRMGQVFHDHPYLLLPTQRGLQPSTKSNSSSAGDELLPCDAFKLRHYAGWVTYTVSGFVEKNGDLVARSLSQAMYQCSHPMIKDLFPEGNLRRTMLRRPATTVSQFRVAVTSLIRSIKSKSPHYIRCIRPNSFKQPHHFDQDLVLHQIRYLCLLETIRVRKNGYIFRQPYAGFLQRYKMLSPVTWPHWSSVAIEGVARLLRDLPISATEYAFGRRKLFIKHNSTVVQLERFRRMRLDELAVLIQNAFRTWSARRLFLRKRQSQIQIANAWRRYKTNMPLRKMRWRLSSVARREFLEMRQRRLMAEAVQVIERTYMQWKRRRYLIRLATRLPSLSPTCREWPNVNRFLRDTNQIIKKLYHIWRCHRYRLSFDQIGRNRMREKVTASFLFKNRKESYARSVAHPFQGDYVRLRQNSQWRKMVSETLDNYIVFADIVSKITRSSGRLVPVLFVVSTNSMLILDQRTLSIKYRVPAADVTRISLSPYLDDIAVFHVKTFDRPIAPSVTNLHSGCLQFTHTQALETSSSGPSSSMPGPSFNKWKGDLVLQTCHVIELVTKMFLVVQNAAGKAPEVNVHTDFDVSVGHQMLELSFIRCMSLPDQPHPGQVHITRRGHRLEVTL